MHKPPSRTALCRTFGRTVRNLRRRIGLPQENLALESGINRGYMGGLERGLHSPTLDTIFKLLPPLKVTLTEFSAEFERVLLANSRK